jgi:SulP family sulfate permease
VQGAGVSKAYANPDGNYPNSSRDFIGQGAANLGAGLFQGMPIGGAVSDDGAQRQRGRQNALGQHLFRLDRGAWRCCSSAGP